MLVEIEEEERLSRSLVVYPLNFISLNCDYLGHC